MRRMPQTLVGLWVSAAATVGAVTPGERLTNAVLAACNGLRQQRALREEAAEAAAARFTQGGTLWVAGSIPRFDIEWLGRAGGMMPVKVMKSPADIAATDVLVYGCLAGAADADIALLRQVRERQALVVALAPAENAKALREVATFCLTVDAPADTPLRREALASAAMAGLWAFTGDLVAGCTRAGLMPTMWQSVMVPGSRERNATYRSRRFHDGLTVPPQAPGVLGERYLDGICTALAGLRSQQEKVVKAGALLRGALAAKHTVFHANVGHFEPVRLLPPEFPVPLSVLSRKDPDADLRGRAAAGDVLFAVWYTDIPTALLKAAHECGVSSVCILATNPGESRDPALADVWLDPQWVIGDALVEVPGYDVRILPPSGVLNATVFYAVMAETQEAAAP